MPNRRIAERLISWIGAGTAPSWPVHICSSGSGCVAEGRLREARERLWVAEEMFAEIGMEAFAERTRGELVAAGAKPRVHPPSARADLTPQEEQIARLARDGLTNAQIGAQLFLSPRTVEWHLNRVFGKLGIDSRDALRLPPLKSETEVGV